MTSPSAAATFAEADLHEVVEKLTQDEAIELIAGVGFWYTAAVGLGNLSHSPWT